MANEVYTFDKATAQALVKAAKMVLSGGKYGTTDNANQTTGVQIIMAQVTAVDTTAGTYAWRQVRRTEGGSEVVTNGLTGTLTERYAFNLPNTELKRVDDLMVLARVMVKESDDSIKPAFVVIDGGPPKGLYQGQVFQMLTDLSDGWDYPTFHSV